MSDETFRQQTIEGLRGDIKQATVRGKHRMMTMEVINAPGVLSMPVPRCDRCRWWTAFAPDLQPAEIGGIVPRLRDEFGERLTSPDPPRLGDCRLFECREREQVEHASKLIVTRTGSGEATIVTHADFGCVQFKATA